MILAGLLLASTDVCMNDEQLVEGTSPVSPLQNIYLTRVALSLSVTTQIAVL